MMLLARASFTTRYDGRDVPVRAGVTRVRAGHPIALAHPDDFEPVASPVLVGRSETELRARDTEGRTRALYDEEALAEYARQRPDMQQAGAEFHVPNRTRTPNLQSLTRPSSDESRTAALQAVERLHRDDALTGEAADRLDDLIERDSVLGLDRRYLAATSSPEYATGWAKLLRYGAGATYRLTAAEQEAVQRVTQVEEMRAMALGTNAGADGGLAVPAQIDPTIILSSDGATNPIRQLATVSTITTSELRLVTSEGITATFSPEAQEATDDSPSLVQPKLIPERCLMWVPYSFEVGMDWSGLAAELAKLFADAKDVVEAEKFANGAGHTSTEPEGIVAGLDAANSEVATSGSGTYAVGDLYSIAGDLGARWQPRASWLMSNTIRNVTAQFVAAADPEHAPIFDAQGRLLNKPVYEVSTLDSTTAAGDHPLVYGDIRSAYRIVDRLGLSVELVPIVAGSHGRPTGQRGLLGWFRTTGGVVVSSAARLLTVKS